MKQPLKKNSSVKKTTSRKSKKPYKRKTYKSNPFKIRRKKNDEKYGTSRLEYDFAMNFLVKNDIKFVYQFEAKDIKRFYDFAIVANNNIQYVTESVNGVDYISQNNENLEIDLLIEVDGGYYHSDPRVVDENKLNPMQKHNKFVDGLKDKWAGLHCIPLLRIWEYDIRHNPDKVMEELSKYIKIGERKRNIINNKRRKH